MTTAAVEAATTSAVEPLSYRGRPDGAAAARTAEIFERHGPTVLGLCRMLLRNEHEAEDASQQTFLAAYRSIRNGVEPRHPAAWLATIARNECWAAIERRMREPFHQGELESRLPDPVVQAAANADLEELWRAIGELPRQQRRALLLREFSGLTYAELAGALGVTEPAVESLLVRARRELRGRLRPLSGSAAALAAPLGALRDALARLVLGMPDAPAASGLAKLAAGAAAVVVAGGTVGAIETHDVGREVGTPPADAAVAPGAVTLPVVRSAAHARRTNPPARVPARSVSRHVHPERTAAHGSRIAPESAVPRTPPAEPLPVTPPAAVAVTAAPLPSTAPVPEQPAVEAPPPAPRDDSGPAEGSGSAGSVGARPVPAPTGPARVGATLGPPPAPGPAREAATTRPPLHQAPAAVRVQASQPWARAAGAGRARPTTEARAAPGAATITAAGMATAAMATASVRSRAPR
jgi:RNA polymerase sigma factor (sigma-70 family)